MKIDKNVPAPKLDGRGAPPKYPFKEMEVWDSIFFEDSNDQQKVGLAARNFFMRHKKKCSIRKEGTGFRIWRTA